MAERVLITKASEAKYEASVSRMQKAEHNRSIKSSVWKPKLKIGHHNDIYEQEANRVAQKVMRIPDPVLQRKCAKRDEDEKRVLQTKGLTGKASLTQIQDIPPIVHDVLHSPGQPLDAATRAFMELRFAHDFSQVRVHTDAKAAKSARAVNSLAYTVRHDIIFGAGQYAPSTHRGKKLLVHELTHVMQQSAGAKGMQDRLGISHPNDPAEQEAKTISKDVMHDEILPTALSQKIQVARDAPDAGSDTPDATIATPDVGSDAPDATIATPDAASDNISQLKCVIRLGGCPNIRPGGIPSPEEITEYNKQCRDETNYGGSDITPTNEECGIPPIQIDTSPPIECPIGGSAPQLKDPQIFSGSKCRGACGPDCPPRCTKPTDYTIEVPDSTNSRYFICTYPNTIQCGSHKGCREHDDCYDTCGNNTWDLCHRQCDIECIKKYGLQCNDWRQGLGQFDSFLLFSDPPKSTGPFPMTRANNPETPDAGSNTPDAG